MFKLGYKVYYVSSDFFFCLFQVEGESKKFKDWGELKSLRTGGLGGGLKNFRIVGVTVLGGGVILFGGVNAPLHVMENIRKRPVFLFFQGV